MADFDVCVLGGGPAGSITALRLASLGHRVCLVERSAFPRRHAGESLTKGIWPILDSAGLREIVLRGGALVPSQALVRWAQPDVEHLTSDQLRGCLLVDRGNFDALLLRAAASEDVRIFQPAKIHTAVHEDRGWQITIVMADKLCVVEAAYLVDATGRTGFLRAKRQRLSPRTVAVWGHLDCRTAAPGTVVEASRDYWCWGASVPGGKFSAMVFLDPDALRSVRRDNLEAFWRSCLAKTELFAAMSAWPMASALQVRDATTYFAADPIGSSFVRVGEASYALDPLSSTGVEKAMQSGHLAATAIHTLIEHPSRAALCLRFYRERQRETVSAHAAWVAEFYGAVARYADAPFWRARSVLPDPSWQAKKAPAAPLASAKFTLQTAVRVTDRVEIG